MSNKNGKRHRATAELIGELVEDPKFSQKAALAQLTVVVRKSVPAGDGPAKTIERKHFVKAWDGCCEAAKKLRKGDLVRVVGEIRTEAYEADEDDKSRAEGKPEKSETQFFTRIYAEGKAGGVVERL